MRSISTKVNQSPKDKINKRESKRQSKEEDDPNKENDFSQSLHFKDTLNKGKTSYQMQFKPIRKSQPLSQQISTNKRIKVRNSKDGSNIKKGLSQKTTLNSSSKKKQCKSIIRRLRQDQMSVIKNSVSERQGNEAKIESIEQIQSPLIQMEDFKDYQVNNRTIDEFESAKQRQNRLSMETLTLSEISPPEGIQQLEKSELNAIQTPLTKAQFGFISSDQLSPDESKNIIMNLKSDEKLAHNKQNFRLYSQQRFSQDTIDYLVQRQKDYVCDKDQIFTNQTHIKPFMREMLIDWVMEVSDEFKLKKQTFYLSVFFIDKYLSIKSNLKLEKFQLLGATALFIASKIEEIYCPRVKDFELATDCGFNEEQILKMERKIMMRLQWLANPTTINAWANCFMQKWDFYAQENPQGLNILDPHYYQPQKVPLFKSDFNEDYVMFREAMQALDMCVMDLEYQKHDSRYLAIVSIVISLGLTLKVFQRYQVGETSSMNRPNFLDIFLDNKENEFSKMILYFCENQCGITVTDLRDTFKFLSQFYLAESQLQLPNSLKEQQATTQEEFYSFQVHYKKLQEQIAMVRQIKQSLQPLDN